MKDSPPLEDDARLAPSVTGLHLTLPAPTLPAPVIDPSMVHAIMGMASDDVGSNCKLDRLFPNFLTSVSRVSNFLQLSAEEQAQTENNRRNSRQIFTFSMKNCEVLPKSLKLTRKTRNAMKFNKQLLLQCFFKYHRRC